MKLWEKCFLLGIVYLAPHVPMPIGFMLGVFFLVMTGVAYLKDKDAE